MLRYNLDKKGNKKCEGNKGMIRKNIKHMNKEEMLYINSMIKSIKWFYITKHAEEKQLLSIMDVKKIIEDKKYQIIDYNYHIDTKEERVMLRTKSKYKIKDNNGKLEECYCKIVISLTTHYIVTIWANKVIDEERKQNNITTRYYEKFDIINKKVKF